MLHIPIISCVLTLASFFFFFNDTATTEIYTLSLHDALPICVCLCLRFGPDSRWLGWRSTDRKSTRLNSSHANISYAVFCLKKNKNNRITAPETAPTKTATDVSSNDATS